MMTQIKFGVVKKELLMEFLREMYNDLRFVQARSSGADDALYLVKLDSSRSLIGLDEVNFYFDYKVESIGEEGLVNSELDHAIQYWVGEQHKMGYRFLSFNPEEAKEREDTLYFYDNF